MSEKINGVLSVGYDRQIVTPENGTWLGGYGNGPDRPSIGKMFEDDDLFVTAIALTDKTGETVIIMTVDLVRMPYDESFFIRKNIEKETGINRDNIIMCATHSHSSPDSDDGGPPAVEPWNLMFEEKALIAAKNALNNRLPAEAFMGVSHPENLTFVRRLMKNGEFSGTEEGDAHETVADNSLQLLKFVREGGEDIVVINWGSHPDHSFYIGGARGTPEFRRGVSADFIYSLRKTVEEKSGSRFAFFQAPAGNLIPMSCFPEESKRVDDRIEKDQVIRPIAYGRELADEVLALLNAPLTKLDLHGFKGLRTDLPVHRPKGIEVGSAEYNRSYAIAAVTKAKLTLEEPTKESKEAALMLIKEYNLGDMENVKRLVANESAEMHDYALVVKVLYEGGKLEKTTQATRYCSMKMCEFWGYNSGPYGMDGVVRKAHNALLPPFDIPLYAITAGDLAFVGAPAEIFDTDGMEVKAASPYKMTFYCEQCGGTFGYYPSALAWSHGGYELDLTNGDEHTAGNISKRLIEMLNTLHKEKP